MQNTEFFQNSYFREHNNVLNVAFGKVLRVMKNLYKKQALLKPPTTDSSTHRQLTTYPLTHWALTHRPTDQLLLTCVEIEDQILNMFCIL